MFVRRAASAEDDVILRIGAVIKHICLEKSNVSLIVLGETLCFFNSLSGDIKGGHMIAAFGKKHRVFAFTAADIQYAVGFDRRKDFHNIIADTVGHESPVIVLRVIPPVIVRDNAAVTEQRIDCCV